MAEIGIACNDPDALQSRLLVSTGVEFLEPDEANSQGYYIPYLGDVIVPSGSPREATPEQLTNIIAGPDTTRTLQLCQLPLPLGEAMLRECAAIEFPDHTEPLPFTDIAPGIKGYSLGARLDDAEVVTASVNPKVIIPNTSSPSKVGLHIDSWKDPDLSLLIGNGGPGERWHCFAPEFNREAVGGATRRDYFAFLKNHPNPASIELYWLKLGAPESNHMEALLNAPVAWVLHDGSTWNCPEPSTAFFYAIDPVQVGTYPSVLDTD